MQKIINVDLCVSSKLYDLVAKTAKSTLDEMGYKGFSGLSRNICYSFKIKAEDNKSAEAIVKGMVEKTPFFVNPNKDVWSLGIKKKRDVISCLIFYLEDKRAERIMDYLKNQGFNMVLDVLVGEVWNFSLLLPKKKGIRLVEDIIVSKGPSSGLLANLHSQGYKII